MIGIFTVLPADTLTDEIMSVWRDVLMKIFFAGITEHGMEAISSSNRDRDFCSGWEGIRCQGNEVKRVYFKQCRFGNFNIDALPPTVREFGLPYCGQTFQIQTRCLPRDLIILSLEHNDITGTADLSQLPPKLELARFWHNKLEGPIDLTMLPRNLKILNLATNKIRQHTVYYDNLPKIIEWIQMDNSKIQEVRAIHKAMAVQADVEIFIGISPKNIH